MDEITVWIPPDGFNDGSWPADATVLRVLRDEHGWREVTLRRVCLDHPHVVVDDLCRAEGALAWIEATNE